MKTREVPGSKAQRLRHKLNTLSAGDRLRIAIKSASQIGDALNAIGMQGSVSKTHEVHFTDKGTKIPVWLLVIK